MRLVGALLGPWLAGAVSELALFGSGITNYFKFLKWCAWTSLCLFAIYVRPSRAAEAYG